MNEIADPPTRSLPRGRIVHYYRRAFDVESGVTTAIRWWVNLARDQGWETLVVGEPGSLPGDYGPVATIPHYPPRRRASLPNGLGDVLASGDILYVHEGWVPANLHAVAVAHQRNIPTVAMPHGVYEPALVSALRLGAVRQRAESWQLRKLSRVHLFYDSERETLKPLGLVPRAFVVPTGYDFPDVSWRGNGDYIAWFGRYDVKHKGLDNLLFALASLPSCRRPRLHLRGVDYAGGKHAVAELVQELHLEDSVLVGPPVLGADKWDFLAAARAFVHPARWDAAPIALIEALGVGVPSIVSSGTRVSGQLAAANAAVVVEDVDALATALAEPPGPEVGQAAQAFIGHSHDRSRIAGAWSAQMESL